MKKIYVSLLFSFCALLYSQKKWSLESCIEYAKKHNFQVKNAEYSKELQQYNLLIAKKEKLPSVSGNMVNTLNFGQTQGFQGSIGRNDNFGNNISIGSNMTIYNGGRLNKSLDQSKILLEASEYDIKTIHNNLSLQIIREYLNILLKKEVVNIQRKSLKNAEILLEKSKITTNAGLTPRINVVEAESNVAKEKQILKNAEIEVKRSLFDLALLLQLEDYKNFDIEDIFIEDIQFLETKKVNLRETVEKQPQIKALEKMLKAKEIETEIKKTAYYPTVTASVSLGSFYFNSLVRDNVGVSSSGKIIKEKDIFSQYKTNFSQRINLSINFPIFNKGVTKLQIQQSKINELVEENRLLNEKQDLFKKIQKAVFDKESNYEKYIASIEAEKSAKLALEYANKSYNAGRTSIYDFNVVSNNYFNAASNTIQAKYNFYFSVKLLEFYLKD